MTAEDAYKALLERGEEIGLATVYRVLTQFVGAGLAEKHHFEGGQACSNSTAATTTIISSASNAGRSRNSSMKPSKMSERHRSQAWFRHQRSFLDYLRPMHRVRIVRTRQDGEGCRQTGVMGFPANWLVLRGLV